GAGGLVYCGRRTSVHPPLSQENEQKERAGHARLDGFLHPALSSSTVPLLILTCPSYERRYRPPPLCTRRPRTRCARVARERRSLRAPPPAARATDCARDVPIAAAWNCSGSGGAPVGKISPP